MTRLLRRSLLLFTLLTAAAPVVAEAQDRRPPTSTIATPGQPMRPCRLPSSPSSLPDRFNLERCQPGVPPQLHRQTPPEHRLAVIYALSMLGLFVVFQLAHAK